MAIYQTNPVKEYRIWCTTDIDLSQDGLPPNFEKAEAVLLAYREDYPNDKFQLFALIDA